MILFDTRDAAGLLPGQDGGGPGEGDWPSCCTTSTCRR